ncbi:MAG: hypothetical protein RLZZ399_2185 [Verrucomicrobiota bacterium]|jgi:hypothetical protein
MNPSRRAFLRSAGALIALPALESFGFRRFVHAEPTRGNPPPKRMIAITFGYGITNETWYPDPKITGAAYTLSPGLKPLQRHQSRITVIQGLSNKFSNEGHWGSTFYLTGANRYAVPGLNFFNSVSADQVVAEQFGKQTRFDSLQLNSADNKESGHGPGLSLAWNRQGKPIAGIEKPLAVFQRLFGAEETSLEERQRQLAENRSVLDTVLVQAKALDRKLSTEDRRKMEEYFESIRAIETRLSKEASWMNRPKPAPGVQPPGETLNGVEETRIMHDLMIAALRTDSTRVITYRQPHWNLCKALDIDYHPHDISHYGPGSRMEASQKRDVKMSELLAEFLDKLLAAKEADGSSLLDHVSLSFGSNIRSTHSLDNCPTILAGGGAGVKHGRHLVLAAKQTPLCNLWLTLMQGLGVDVPSHGDSTGTLSQLFSA